MPGGGADVFGNAAVLPGGGEALRRGRYRVPMAGCCNPALIQTHSSLGIRPEINQGIGQALA